MLAAVYIKYSTIFMLILICSVGTGAVAVVFNCTVENLFVFNYRLEHSLSIFFSTECGARAHRVCVCVCPRIAKHECKQAKAVEERTNNENTTFDNTLFLKMQQSVDPLPLPFFRSLFLCIWIWSIVKAYRPNHIERQWNAVRKR